MQEQSAQKVSSEKHVAYICLMILVTGGTGLVGAHLLLHLAAGNTPMRALYRSEANIAKTRHLFEHYNRLPLFEKVEWVQGDILDVPLLEDAFAGVEYVYHCAALISYDPADEDTLRKVNIEGTANMVNLSLAYGVKKFCHVSSVAALGDPKEGEHIITEETEWNPEANHHDYALSKYGAEMEVWRAWQEGLDVVIINPGVIYGYGFWEQGSGEMFNAVKNGQLFYTRANIGTVVVSDVVKIMMQLMASDISGERFTVVAENLTLEEILNTIADGMGKKRPPYYATPLMTSIGWRANWLLSKLLFRKRKLSRAMARSAHNTDAYDNSKVVNTLGYRFRDVKAFLKNPASIDY